MDIVHFIFFIFKKKIIQNNPKYKHMINLLNRN